MKRIDAYRDQKNPNKMKMLSRMIKAIADGTVSGCGMMHFWPPDLP